MNKQVKFFYFRNRIFIFRELIAQCKKVKVEKLRKKKRILILESSIIKGIIEMQVTLTMYIRTFYSLA